MEILESAGRIIMPILALLIVAFCVPSLLKGNKKIGITGYLVNEANGDKLPLSGYEVSIGRSKVCDIVLGYSTVSRFHAVLSKRKKGWRVTDTRSKTGTYINNGRIDKPCALEDGDTIVFGNAVFVFVENTPISPENVLEEPEYEAEEEYETEPERADYIVDERTGNAYRIDGLITCMIGSGTDVQIRLRRQNVSARHAMLVFDDGTESWSVLDMDSAYGTLLNGRPVRRMTRLYDGDSINICGSTLIFRSVREESV